MFYGFIRDLIPHTRYLWERGESPVSWTQATIIPIPNPGKDNTNPNNYRPIALTSCVCKTMERMINISLVRFLECNNILSNTVADPMGGGGSRRGRTLGVWGLF